MAVGCETDLFVADKLKDGIDDMLRYAFGILEPKTPKVDEGCYGDVVGPLGKTAYFERLVENGAHVIVHNDRSVVAIDARDDGSVVEHGQRAVKLSKELLDIVVIVMTAFVLDVIDGMEDHAFVLLVGAGFIAGFAIGRLPMHGDAQHADGCDEVNEEFGGTLAHIFVRICRSRVGMRSQHVTYWDRSRAQRRVNRSLFRFVRA